MKITITMNGEKHELEDRPIDHIAYSTTARRHKWPTNAAEDPILFGYFVAYSAAKRTGLVPDDTGFSAFLTDCEDIDMDTDEGGVPTTDPTETASLAV